MAKAKEAKETDTHREERKAAAEDEEEELCKNGEANCTEDDLCEECRVEEGAERQEAMRDAYD